MEDGFKAFLTDMNKKLRAHDVFYSCYTDEVIYDLIESEGGTIDNKTGSLIIGNGVIRLWDNDLREVRIGVVETGPLDEALLSRVIKDIVDVYIRENRFMRTLGNDIPLQEKCRILSNRKKEMKR